ncbi:hypothetical protein [uncultured Sulfitobacter sp.]|uniref:hypothetical protein n=1 Tax=uncultured Sulfitobacter sp. TaxID=191468 RepID=UPI0026050D11|nr:hypothetical protein [uncultured Sulfitobacter sp.]
MKYLTGLAMSVAFLAGCTSAEDRIYFDGQYYNSKLRKIDGQIDVFTVSVAPVSRSLAGAVEAGEYEATVHCVNNYGSSDVIWTVGPDTPQTLLPIQNDTLLFQGRCPGGR